MRKLFLFLISVCTVLFNMQFCQAIRFDPALTDEDLRILGNKYSSVGMVIHEVEYVFEDGSHYSVEPVKSTATLVSLPNFKQDDGSLILVSNHAFKNWNKEEHSFSFTLNGETSRIINYFQAPAEDLIETWWCCFSSATTLQRDFGFALLEKPIKSTSPAQLILDNFSDLPSDAILTTVGVGDAGRLDSFYTFTDNQRRAMETYVHEYKVATVDQGIKAQQDDDPLRLEHTYSSARDDLHGNLVRGKIADKDSGGPIFMNNSVIGVAKGSGYFVTQGQQRPELQSTVAQDIIDALKTNNLLNAELKISTALSPDPDSYIMESLGGASDWITNTLPQMIQQALEQTMKHTETVNDVI